MDLFEYFSSMQKLHESRITVSFSTNCKPAHWTYLLPARYLPDIFQQKLWQMVTTDSFAYPGKHKTQDLRWYFYPWSIASIRLPALFGHLPANLLQGFFYIAFPSILTILLLFYTTSLIIFQDYNFLQLVLSTKLSVWIIIQLKTL